MISPWRDPNDDTLRLAGAWTGSGFIDWEGINFNSRHVVHPRTIGDLQFETADGPGWANPATGTFDDPRFVGPDGRRFGPLPRTSQRYRGLYRSGERAVISYTVGDAAILESHDLESLAAQPVFVRTLNVGKSSRDLLVRVDIDVPKKMTDKEKEALKAYAAACGDEAAPVSESWRSKFKKFFP